MLSHFWFLCHSSVGRIQVRHVDDVEDKLRDVSVSNDGKLLTAIKTTDNAAVRGSQLLSMLQGGGQPASGAHS